MERHGWALKRTTRSSHFIYAHPDKPDVILSVPVHGNRDLKKGLLHSLLKDAGLSEDDV